MDEFNIEKNDNYLSCYNATETDILSRYVALINEFLTQAYESFKSDIDGYFTYITNNGIDTITHVYRFLLLYTKNLDLASYNCKKAIYYYIEFICHLSNNKCENLKLTAKDASLFVYGRTLFTINKSLRKYNNTTIIDDNIFYITEIFRSCFIYRTTSSINTILDANTLFVEDITEMFKKTNSVCYNKKLKCLLRFCERINKDKYEILSFMVRKITRNDIELSSINKAIDYALSIDNMPNKQFVSVLFSKCVSC